MWRARDVEDNDLGLGTSRFFQCCIECIRLSFFSHPELRLSRISPTLAPEAGGTLLALHGRCSTRSTRA